MKNVQPSADIVSQNIARLKELFPEAVSEGSIDFAVLRQLLGDENVLEEDEEKFGLNWHGKKQARQIALTPSMGTLVPCPEQSKNWDTTQNLFVEGDNLEVLKLLQKSYANKVKMIYIDPPYNTGKEFIYPDKFADNLDTYLKYTRQMDNEGIPFTTNTETNGRKHTNWLNMMYPRLFLAKNLLRKDGIIFISIDDNEVANLKELCNEIFGEENFVAQLVWKRRASSGMADNNVSTDHEYVLSYKKLSFQGVKGYEKDYTSYSNPDNDPRGDWTLGDLTVGMTASMRPNQAYNLKDPKTNKEYKYNPNRVWAYIPDSMDKLIFEDKIFFPKDISKRPMIKRFKSELQNIYNPFSSIMIDKVGLNTEGTKIIQRLLESNIFGYSKPISLLKVLMSQVCIDDRDIILDFFAGSATTAHAVMQLNREDGGKRKYICVQLPEYCDEKSEAHKAGYQTIADIGRERIRRAAKKIAEQGYTGDLGFRAFRLSRSNIIPWNPDPSDLEETLLSHQEHLIAGAQEQDILYELLLKRGIKLSVPIERREADGKTIYCIGCGMLFACLAESITEIEGIAKCIVDWHEELENNGNTHVFFRDSAFSDDIAKTNMAAILEQNKIPHMRSL